MDAKKHLDIFSMRNASGMTQQEFSNYFGFSKRSVESWEEGKRECPDYLLRLIAYKLEHEGLIPPQNENPPSI